MTKIEEILIEENKKLEERIKELEAIPNEIEELEDRNNELIEENENLYDKLEMLKDVEHLSKFIIKHYVQGYAGGFEEIDLTGLNFSNYSINFNELKAKNVYFRDIDGHVDCDCKYEKADKILEYLGIDSDYYEIEGE